MSLKKKQQQQQNFKRLDFYDGVSQEHSLKPLKCVTAVAPCSNLDPSVVLLRFSLAKTKWRPVIKYELKTKKR